VTSQHASWMFSNNYENEMKSNDASKPLDLHTNYGKLIRNSFLWMKISEYLSVIRYIRVGYDGKPVHRASLFTRSY
jgi:hypothetical protein